MELKNFTNKNVLTAAKERISKTFDDFDKIMISFSGGKDSSVMFHLVMEEAVLRGRKVGVMLIDFEAQYQNTVNHAKEMFELLEKYNETVNEYNNLVYNFVEEGIFELLNVLFDMQDDIEKKMKAMPEKAWKETGKPNFYKRICPFDVWCAVPSGQGILYDQGAKRMIVKLKKYAEKAKELLPDWNILYTEKTS